MKNLIGIFSIIFLLMGCDDTKNDGGEIYEDVWYLISSNPNAGIIVLEVNAKSHKLCGKYFNVKKMIIWDRFNETLQADSNKNIEARNKLINKMTREICDN